MTFKKLAIGDFFIPSKRSEYRSKYGTSLWKKTGSREMRSMDLGVSFPVWGDSVMKQDQAVIKIIIDRAIFEKHG